jgi:hypothetical protein
MWIRRRARAFARLCLLLPCASGLAFAGVDPARAEDDSAFHEIETKYIFGFTEGSGIGLEGEKEFAPTTVGSFGKRDGRYGVTETELEFEFTPNQYIQIELGPLVSTYGIHGVTGLDDRDAVNLSGFVGELRYLLVDRGSTSPLAVTLAVEPEWHAYDETSGAPVINYGLETRINADVELLKNRAYLGFNVLYEPETTRIGSGVWQDESTWGVSTALAYRITPKVTVGAEVWYLRHYDGAFFNTFTGDCVYAGPNIYVQITPKVFVTAAWNMQVAGHEITSTGSLQLDLTDFSRQRARVKVAVEF